MVLIATAASAAAAAAAAAAVVVVDFDSGVQMAASGTQTAPADGEPQESSARDKI